MPLGLALAERVGRALGFSPEGRRVRVWVRSRPGEEDAVIVPGSVSEVSERAAVVTLAEPVTIDGRELRRVRVVPREPGWGFHALWFGFIVVDAVTLEGTPIGRWWLRLRPR